MFVLSCYLGRFALLREAKFLSDNWYQKVDNYLITKKIIKVNIYMFFNISTEIQC